MRIDPNQESLQLLESNIRSIAANQRDDFDREIRKITHANSARGKLRSGDTIRQLQESMRKLLDGRATAIIASVQKLPFIYTDSLRPDLIKIVDRYLPVDFNDFRLRYLDVVQMTNDSQRVSTASLELAERSNEQVRRSVLSGIDQHVLILKSDTARSMGNKRLLFTEILGLLVTAFLAGMWVVDPSGHYEPWIALIAVATASIEIYRRFIAASK